MTDIELDLGYAKQIMASVAAMLEGFASRPAFAPEDRQSFRDMADDIEEALNTVCLADAHLNADRMIERMATGAPPPAGANPPGHADALHTRQGE